MSEAPFDVIVSALDRTIQIGGLSLTADMLHRAAANALADLEHAGFRVTYDPSKPPSPQAHTASP